MSSVTISADFRVVIPKDCRESLGFKPGLEVEAIPYEGCLVMIPAEPMQKFRGFLAGTDTLIKVDEDRA